MQHVIIIIFDSIKYTEDRIQLVDAPLKAVKFNDNFKIYYLKITTKSNELPHDVLFAIVPNAADPLSPIGDSFDFTSPESLNNAVTIIQSRQQEETSYYLISLGHGSGFGFFQRDGKTSVTRAERFIEGCSISIKEQVSFEILWNIEFYKAFESITFELAIFNNCNVTLLENCAIFSPFIKYLIGAQNFIALEMFDLGNVLQQLFNAIPNQPLEGLGEFIYDHYIISSLKRILDNSQNIEESSLFYINLQCFMTIYKDFENIALQLVNMAEENADWVIGIREKQNIIGASIKTIDLIEFLENVRLDKLPTTGLKNDISHFLASVENSIIGKWRHKNKKRLNGIAVYFPKIDSFEYEEKYIFHRNLLCSSQFLKPSNWDKLLDKVSSNLSRNK